MPTSSDFVGLGGDPLTARPTLVIGEVAQAHDGSLGMAHAFIDAVAAAQADAIKFQTHLASAESTAEETWRVKFSKQDADRQAYWKRMEFTESQWQGLKDHATERGLLFLSSPFSDEAVDLLSRLGVAAWKVASGEVSNHPMLDRMVATGLPMLVSTGVSGWAEIDEAVAGVKIRPNKPQAALVGLDQIVVQPLLQPFGVKPLNDDMGLQHGCGGD